MLNSVQAIKSNVQAIKSDIEDENNGYKNFNKDIATSLKYMRVNAKYLNNCLLKKLVVKIWSKFNDYNDDCNINRDLKFLNLDEVRLYKFHKYWRLGNIGYDGYFAQSNTDDNGSLILIRVKHGIFHQKNIRKANISDVLALISSLERIVGNIHFKENVKLKQHLNDVKKEEHIDSEKQSWDNLRRQIGK